MIDEVKPVRSIGGLLKDNSAFNQLWETIVQKVTKKTTAYTVLSSDVGCYLQIENANAVNVTITNFVCEIGACITFEQSGAGIITLVASGVTLNSLNAGLSSAGQYSVFSIIKVAESTFTVIGGVV